MHLHTLVSVPLAFIGGHLGHMHVEAGCSKPNGVLHKGTSPIPRYCLMLPAFGCCILHASTYAQDGLDPLQPALVYGVFLPSSIYSTDTTLATCTGSVFLPNSAFANVQVHLLMGTRTKCNLLYMW